MSNLDFKDWASNVYVSDTCGRGWCVRIDGCDVFDEINKYKVKTRRTFSIASDLKSKEEAKKFAVEWLKNQGGLHCANQALIAKQAGQIKILREALEMFRPEIYYNQDGEEIDVGGNFTIYADGDADNEAMQKVHEALEATKEQA